MKQEGKLLAFLVKRNIQAVMSSILCDWLMEVGNYISMFTIGKVLAVAITGRSKMNLSIL